MDLHEDYGLGFWIKILGVLLSLTVSSIIFVYSTFQTRADATKDQDSIEKRLERIENKVDRLLNDH